MEKNIFKKQNDKKKNQNNKIPFHYDDKGRKIYDIAGTINNPSAPKINPNKDNPTHPKITEELTYLKARTDLKSDILNAKEILKSESLKINLLNEEAHTAFFCKVCNCSLQDNQAYLDHLNGKRHNQLLGMNMRVEKVGVDKIREKLLSMKRKTDKSLQSKHDLDKNFEKLEQIGK